MSKPSLRGDLKIEVHFARGGAFDRIEFLADELEDADLRACVGASGDEPIPNTQGPDGAGLAFTRERAGASRAG